MIDLSLIDLWLRVEVLWCCRCLKSMQILSKVNIYYKMISLHRKQVCYM